MEYQTFPALLRSQYNGILEYGQAVVSARGDALNFTSEFVPLIPLGTHASIEWILGEKTLATFLGSVYLSTQNLLQLVEIDPLLLAKTASCFEVNTSLPATIGAGTRSENAKSKAISPAEIRYLSLGQVKLLTPAYFAEGDSILLSCEVDFLTLHRLELRVRQRILLRRGEAFLLCDVESGGNENFIALSSYVAKLANQAEPE